MADFRRKEYRGSLLLVQECGPVDILVDTEDKTVTPSLAKADTEYSIAGGGGGLEYVIPEQTVTLTQSGSDGKVEITENGLDDLQAGDRIILKLFYVNFSSYSYIDMGKLEGNTVEGEIPMLGIAIISRVFDKWYFTIDTEEQGFFPQELTISAIRGF